MPVARYITAGEIVNRAALECGLTPVGDPFTSTDPAFAQLIGLLNSGCQDLVGLDDCFWPQLQKQGTITLTGTPNRYSVPTDFSHFIAQTGWQDTAFSPIGGPLTPQLWAVAAGQGLASPITVSFRMAQNQFWIFPTDTAAGPVITYDYIKRAWAVSAASADKDTVTLTDDTVMFEPVLVVNLLKWKFLSAKGFASQDAKSDFGTSLSIWQGKGNSSPILNMARQRAPDRLLTMDNVGETDFGS